MPIAYFSRPIAIGNISIFHNKIIAETNAKKFSRRIYDAQTVIMNAQSKLFCESVYMCVWVYSALYSISMWCVVCNLFPFVFERIIYFWVISCSCQWLWAQTFFVWFFFVALFIFIFRFSFYSSFIVAVFAVVDIVVVEWSC